MKDASFADKISKCEVTLQSLEGAVPNIPGSETYVAEVRQEVDALRASQEGVQALRGQLTDAVIIRQRRNREASAALRHLAAVVRARYGFANPVIESFNIPPSTGPSAAGSRRRRPRPKPDLAGRAVRTVPGSSHGLQARRTQRSKSRS